MSQSLIPIKQRCITKNSSPLIQSSVWAAVLHTRVKAKAQPNHERPRELKSKLGTWSVRFMYSGRKIRVSCDIDEGDEDPDYGNRLISADKLELVECI